MLYKVLELGLLPKPTFKKIYSVGSIIQVKRLGMSFYRVLEHNQDYIRIELISNGHRRPIHTFLPESNIIIYEISTNL